MTSPELVLICGHARSGTTLLSSLLDGHPELVVFPYETFYLKKAVNSPDEGARKLAQRLVNSIVRKYRGRDDLSMEDRWDMGYIQGDFEYFQEAFWRHLDQTEMDFMAPLQALMAAHAEATGQTGRCYYVEKTHGNEHYLTAVKQRLPGMKALYIKRDPRDVYVSWRRRMETSGKPHSLPTFICRWGISISLWRRFQRSYPQSSFSLRYEDLVKAPEGTMEAAALFLEIPFMKGLIEPTNQGQRWGGNSLHGRAKKGISTRPIGRYKTTLTEEEQQLIETYLGSRMITQGYELSYSPNLVNWLNGLPEFRGNGRRFLKMTLSL